MYLYTSVIIQYARSQVQHGVSHALASEFGEFCSVCKGPHGSFHVHHWSIGQHDNIALKECQVDNNTTR